MVTPRRIGMGLVGPGFVGTHHIDAVRRLGFVDVVAIADVDERRARQGRRARRAQGIRQLRGARRRSRRARRPQHHAELPARPGHSRGARARQAHRVGEAARLVRRGSACAVARGARGRRRPCRDVQLPRQSDGAAGARDGRRRAILAPRTTSMAATCRTGCSSRPTFPGVSNRTRVAPAPRWRTSAPTGATWRSTSPAAVSHPCSPICRRLSPSRYRPRAAREAFAERRRRRTRRAGSDAQRGSGDDPRAVRGRCQGRGVGRAGLRRAQERLVARGKRSDVVAAVAAGTAERALDRPPR